MDAKAGLMIFGVVLLLAAIFFFFKSFASHENRMQEEQRARIELERMKLEAERNATRRPLTPEEMARRKRMEEERQKADAAKRALAAEQRKAWQQEQAKRIDAQKAAKAQRRQQEEEAKAKAADEASLQEARNRENEEKRKRVAEQNLTQERERISGLFVQVQDQAKKTTACVEATIRLAEPGAEDLDRQVRATKTKIEVFGRQVAQQEQVVAAILPDTKWICPNLICNRFTPDPTASRVGSRFTPDPKASRVGSRATPDPTDTRIGYRSTPDSTASRMYFKNCPRCATELRVKDFNEERRAAAQAELNKLRQKAAFEEQISQATNAASAKADMQSVAQYRGQLSQLAEDMDDLKSGIETADVGQLAVIGQSIQKKQEALGLIMKALPKEAVAQAVTTNRPNSSVPKNKPPAKIYVLNDGRMIEVQTEMTVGDEIVIKTSQGEMLTIDKKTIQASTTQ